MRILASCLLSIAGVSLAASASETQLDHSVILERFLASSEQRLVSYEARRHLTVLARNGKMEAALVADTSLDADGTFHYRILSESGSGFLRSRVLRPILEAESAAKRRAKGAHGALTVENYKFTAAGLTTAGLLEVDIKPRRKDDLLMDGSIFLTCDEADLVLMQGLLVKRPSFWTRKVHIVRRYDRIGGVRVPISTGSTADILFAGQSTFNMDYEYSSINGVAVPSAVTQVR